MAVALNRLATLTAQISSDYQTAITLLEEALRLAELSHDQALAAETEWGLAQVMFHAWRPADGLPHAERALSLARQLDDTGLIARSLNVVALLTIPLGEWDRSKTCASEASSLYAGIGNRVMDADSLGHLANAQLMCCDFQGALDTARRMQQMRVAIQNVWSIAMSDFLHAATYRDMGDYPMALEHAQAAVSRVSTIDVPLLFFMIHTVLGTVYRALLRLDDACAEHLKILHVATQLGPRIVEQVAAELCAGLCSRRGVGYCRQLRTTGADCQRLHLCPAMGLPRPYETEALLRGGSSPEAVQDLERFDERTLGRPRFRVSYLRSMASLPHWQCDYDQEIQHLKAASALAQTLGLPGEQWLILASLGDAHQLNGEQVEA